MKLTITKTKGHVDSGVCSAFFTWQAVNSRAASHPDRAWWACPVGNFLHLPESLIWRKAKCGPCRMAMVSFCAPPPPLLGITSPLPVPGLLTPTQGHRALFHNRIFEKQTISCTCNIHTEKCTYHKTTAWRIFTKQALLCNGPQSKKQKPPSCCHPCHYSPPPRVTSILTSSTTH